MTHPFRSPILALLVSISLEFRNGRMGVVTSELLAMGTIIFGLFTIVAPLRATLRTTALVSASRWW